MEMDSDLDLESDSLEGFRKSLRIANLSPMEAQLHEAATFGHFYTMKKLLADQKIDVNSKDTEQKTVLHNASSQGLLRKENKEDEDGSKDEDNGDDKVPILIYENGIYTPCIDTTPEVVQLLIDHGANIGKILKNILTFLRKGEIYIILPFSL